MNDKPFDQQVVIITGGANGIGKAAAFSFGEAGATVVIWDIDKDAGVATKGELGKAGITAFYQTVNTTSLQEAEAAAKTVSDKYSRIDVLINNAGITRDSSMLKMQPMQWQQVIDVNLTGVFNCTKAVAPYMVERRYGRIINISSVVGIYGNFGQSNYVATKAGIIGLTKVWAREFGRKGINVNAVAPGFIETEMLSTIPEDILAQLREKSPLQRLGKPEEVANVYRFLASPDASFINGAVISVDGGLVV